MKTIFKRFPHSIWTVFAVNFCLFLFLAILKYNTFHTTVYDLGLFDQVIYNTLQGHWFYSSIKGMNYLGDHFSPILFLITPFYFIKSNPVTLLFLQCLAVSLSIFPIYQLAKTKLESLPALILVLVFLAHPFTISLELNNFHPEGFALPLIAWALLAIERESWKTFLILMLLILSVKEEMSLLGIGFGTYIFFYKRKYLLGIFLVIVNFAYLLACMKIFIPYFKPENFVAKWVYLDRYNHLGNSFFAIVKTILLHPIAATIKSYEPGSLATLTMFFWPFCFVWCQNLRGVILGAALFAAHYYSDYLPQMDWPDHYLGPLIPVIILGSIYGLARVLKTNIGKRYYLLCFGITLSISFGTRMYYEFEKEFFITPTYAHAMEQVQRLIPSQASLCTSNFMGSHFAHRLHYFLFDSFSENLAMLDHCDFFLWNQHGKDILAPDTLLYVQKHAQKIFDEDGIVLWVRR